MQLEAPAGGRRAGRDIRTATLVLIGVSVATLPFERFQIGRSIGFLPAILAVVGCFDCLSLYFLLNQYRDTGDMRILAMSWAYLWSLALMVAYSLSFPGAVLAKPPLGVTASMAPYMYVLWHGGFPVLLGLAWAPWPGRPRSNPATPRRRRQLVLAATSLTVLALAGSVIAAVYMFARHLPVLIHGVDTSAMTRVTAPVVVPLASLAVIATWGAARDRSGPERWTFVAAVACLCDLVLTYTSRHRWSVGWYAGRTLTMLSAGTVLFSILGTFRRLKAAAEYNASHDSLTGLPNRRSAMERLADFSGPTRPVALVMVDLDLFKQINDRFGHDAGDRVLAAVGRLLPTVVRGGDHVSRLGGEEFLISLPDTHAQGAQMVAEKVRRAIEQLEIEGLEWRLTASLGVACFDAGGDLDELLRDADEALYEAKAAGRNRLLLHRSG